MRRNRSFARSRRRNGKCEFSARLFSQRPVEMRDLMLLLRHGARRRGRVVFAQVMIDRVIEDPLDVAAHLRAGEAAQAPFCEFSEVRAFASKSAEQAARIAGVLTLFDDIDAPEVTERTVEQATTLSLYYLREAVRLFGASAISEEARQVDLLLRWLKQRDEGDFVIADIVRNGPNALRDTKRAKALVATLCGHGAVVALSEMSPVGGKARKEAYRVVR